MDMTPEQKRIAIAEACGWTCDRSASPTKWLHPDSAFYRPLNYLPDYLNDLNAVHEAVASLPSWQQSEWATHMRAIVMRDRTPEMVHPDTGYVTDGAFYNATAAQRAEAFGKTLGLWT